QNKKYSKKTSITTKQNDEYEIKLTRLLLIPLHVWFDLVLNECKYCFIFAVMESFSVDEVSSYTNAIITFVLNGCSTKLPIKEKDMTATINAKGNSFQMALNHAKAALRQTYGLILVNVPNTKSGKAYICYSEDTAKTLLLYDEEQQSHLTLLFVILSYLFMRGSDTSNLTKTNEEELFKFLRSLRIKMDEHHAFFGSNVKKLITETFVKQLYLKREKDTSQLDAETIWGFRAEVEFDKKLLLDATAKLCVQ
ncbi:hypothetical protein DOY81_002236, partial [Sarcophaga bullata]